MKNIKELLWPSPKKDEQQAPNPLFRPGILRFVSVFYWQEPKPDLQWLTNESISLFREMRPDLDTAYLTYYKKVDHKTRQNTYQLQSGIPTRRPSAIIVREAYNLNIGSIHPDQFIPINSAYDEIDFTHEPYACVFRQTSYRPPQEQAVFTAAYRRMFGLLNPVNGWLHATSGDECMLRTPATLVCQSIEVDDEAENARQQKYFDEIRVYQRRPEAITTHFLRAFWINLLSPPMIAACGGAEALLPKLSRFQTEWWGASLMVQLAPTFEDLRDEDIHYMNQVMQPSRLPDALWPEFIIK